LAHAKRISGRLFGTLGVTVEEVKESAWQNDKPML
jgi:hypothetical protein